MIEKWKKEQGATWQQLYKDLREDLLYEIRYHLSNPELRSHYIEFTTPIQCDSENPDLPFVLTAVFVEKNEVFVEAITNREELWKIYLDAVSVDLLCKIADVLCQQNQC